VIDDLLGLFSLFLSSYLAKLNYFIAFLIAGLSSSKSHQGNFPSGDIFLSLSKVSLYSLKTVNILFILAIDLTFDYITKASAAFFSSAIQ
jgi:hypothetical protein